MVDPLVLCNASLVRENTVPTRSHLGTCANVPNGVTADSKFCCSCLCGTFEKYPIHNESEQKIVLFNYLYDAVAP